MIDIQDKTLCCGCAACVQRCPKQCISMYEDGEGFLYPKVDSSLCIDCGLCERVCPVITSYPESKPVSSCAAYNEDEEIRMKSSSGGIFISLARYVIARGGVVYGATFDSEWGVEHGYADTEEGVLKFQGSKYVQSRIGRAYQETAQFLRQGRLVLFSGTPCQIAGLNHFLGKEKYENLISVDVICHGVPSPAVWRKYLERFKMRPKGSVGKNTVFMSLKDMSDISDISVRDKRLGWKKFGFSVWKSASKADKNSVFPSGKYLIDKEPAFYEPLTENVFMRGFLKDLYLRPSCHSCPSKCFRSGSDLTIGDFWGVESEFPELSDDKGISAVLCNTAKGVELLSMINVAIVPCTYSQIFKYNPALEKSVLPHRNRGIFMTSFVSNSYKSLDSLIVRMIRPTLITRCRHIFLKVYNKLIH